MAGDRFHGLGTQIKSCNLFDEGFCDEFSQRDAVALRCLSSSNFEIGWQFDGNDFEIVAHGPILLRELLISSCLFEYVPSLPLVSIPARISIGSNDSPRASFLGAFLKINVR